MKNITIKRSRPDLPSGFHDSKAIFVNHGKSQGAKIEADIMQTARHRTRYVQLAPHQSLDPMCHIYAAKRLVILDGCAQVILDGKEVQMLEGASLRIPAGVEHSVENVGKITLALLELRTGSYLGDDDQMPAIKVVS